MLVSLLPPACGSSTESFGARGATLTDDISRARRIRPFDETEQLLTSREHVFHYVIRLTLLAEVVVVLLLFQFEPLILCCTDLVVLRYPCLCIVGCVHSVYVAEKVLGIISYTTSLSFFSLVCFIISSWFVFLMSFTSFINSCLLRVLVCRTRLSSLSSIILCSFSSRISVAV